MSNMVALIDVSKSSGVIELNDLVRLVESLRTVFRGEGFVQIGRLAEKMHFGINLHQNMSDGVVISGRRVTVCVPGYTRKAVYCLKSW